MRSLLRHRATPVRYASDHVRHLHKALTKMNLQIQSVISDLTGVTGLANLQAILLAITTPIDSPKPEGFQAYSPALRVRRATLGKTARHMQP